MKFVTALLLLAGYCISTNAISISECEKNVLGNCFAVYQQRVDKDVTFDQEHCSRVQKVVDCFAQNAACKGETVDRFRFWILQEAALEKTLGLCPSVAHESLKTAVEGTAYSLDNVVEKYGYDSVRGFCAVEIHETCSKEFFKLMKGKNKKICRDAGKWFECYNKELSKGKYKSCIQNAQIITEYSKFVKANGPALVASATSIANLCD